MKKTDTKYIKVVQRILKALDKYKPEDDIFGQLVSLEEANRRPYLSEKLFKESIPIAQELFGDTDGITKVKNYLKTELKFAIENMEIPCLEATYKYMSAYDYLKGNVNTLKKRNNPCIKVALTLMNTGLNVELCEQEEPAIIELCRQIDLMTKKIPKAK